MTIAELIAELQKYPPSTTVQVWDDDYAEPKDVQHVFAPRAAEWTYASIDAVLIVGG